MGRTNSKGPTTIGDIYLICRRFKTFEIVGEAIFQLKDRVKVIEVDNVVCY